MTERERVLEVIADARVQVDVPIEAGDDLAGGVEAALAGIDAVRHVALGELGEVTSGDGRLRVEARARLTLHLDPAAEPGAARERLAAAGPVAAVERFEAVDAYTVEAY